MSGIFARQLGRCALAVLAAAAACTRAPVQREPSRSVAVDAQAPAWRGPSQTPPQVRPDFVLRTTTGERFDFRRETTARTTLLFFGYTSCPDVCPVHLANIAAVLHKMPPEQAHAVQVIFVTTDPKRDTPRRVRAWLDQFDRSFVGLLGSPGEIDAAQRAAGLLPAVRETGDTGKAGYTVAHAAVVLAFTRDDSAHVVYPFGVRQDDWAHDLPRLVSAWPSALEVRDPYVIAPAPDVAAVYLDLVAAPGRPDSLIRVETRAARAAAVHVSEPRGHLLAMRPTGALAVQDTMRLERGGMHIMLDGLRRPLVSGDTVEVELVFSRAGRRVVRAPVRPVVE